MLPTTVAHLGVLDKITGQFSTIDVMVGRPQVFDSLTIVVRACYKADPQSPSESVAFLDIVPNTRVALDPAYANVEQGQSASLAFHGWMFASAPGVSTLMHPLLDVWLIRCQERS